MSTLTKYHKNATWVKAGSQPAGLQKCDACRTALLMSVYKCSNSFNIFAFTYSPPEIAFDPPACETFHVPGKFLGNRLKSC